MTHHRCVVNTDWLKLPKGCDWTTESVSSWAALCHMLISILGKSKGLAFGKCM